MANLVNLEAATVVHGMRTVLDGVSVGLQTGDRVGVLGLNGSGKTTLLKLLAGIERPDSGRVATLRNTAVAFVPQTSNLPDDRTVREAVLHTFGEAEHVWASDAAVREVLSGLGLPGIGLDTALRTLSGGERRRVALAAALVTDADLLALDEPTNHLDIEAVAWLAGHLQSRRGASVVVTHDRWFLDAIATTTWEVVDGAVLVREGGYSDWVFARAERLRLDRAAEERRKNLARKELAWLRRGPPARTSKPRYRIEAAEAIIAGEPEARNTVELHAFARRRLGTIVLELEDVWASVPSSAGSAAGSARGSVTGGEADPAQATERVLLADVTWRIGPGDRIGVVGVNGSGKSTLLRIMVGELPLTRGRLKTGITVHLGYLSQEVAELPGESRLIEAITEIAAVVQLGDKDVSASALAERFGFTPAQQWTRVAELSGGERRRLQLLRILMAEPNVLILDEPTNDLDTDTLSALEDLLDSWPGTLIVVSHDRYLIERVTDDVYALMGDGAITHLPGGVEEYLRRRRESVAAELAEPPRSASTPTVGTSPAGSTAAAGSPVTQDAATVRALRKHLQRLERRLESLQRKEFDLHSKLAEVGADYVAAAELNASLLQLHGEVAAAEAEWLAAAEALENS